jgi:CDP-diacylglycerol--glycerol-3-phosphate 3-phosphatidyltransferase
VLHVPNILSASRLVFTPIVGALILGGPTARAAAFVLACLVALTDAVDGPLARRMGLCNYFGAMIDMTADKVYMCVTLVCLAVVGLSPVWAAGIIVSRELLVLWLRVVASEHGRQPPIAMCGRLKTFMIYLLVPLALGGVAWQAVWALAAMASASALASLVEYIVKMRSLFGPAFIVSKSSDPQE